MMTKTQRDAWAVLSAAVQARSINAVRLLQNTTGKMGRAVSAVLRNGDWARAEKYIQENKKEQSK